MAPDRRPLSERQAAYLSQMSGITMNELAGRGIADLSDVARWKIDPSLLLFQRVCGRVVRRDPVTNTLRGVPNATVHVEDTDCTFLGFFPTESPWCWLGPMKCRREEIAMVRTDLCGRFYAFIPKLDIDRVVRFRRERICLPEIVRPSIRDLFHDIARPSVPEFPPQPNPPDPPPFRLPAPDVLRQVAAYAGAGVAERLLLLDTRRSFGDATGDVAELLDAPAFAEPLLPPLSTEALQRFEHFAAANHRDHPKSGPARDELLGIVQKEQLYGPFLRCRDVLVPEWDLIFDVPDITFRVTQDVDQDGVEEDIYTEGFFDVRWNTSNIPTVVLQASPIARSSAICRAPSIVCADIPAIRTVGLMPLEAPYYDASTGYATRINRPHSDGLTAGSPTGDATAPFAGTLQLYGCCRIGGATSYRLLYASAETNGNLVPFTGLEWWAGTLSQSGPIHFVPDQHGWYPIPGEDLAAPNFLLDWPSAAYPNGKYRIQLELKKDGAIIAGGSPSIHLMIDNRAPQAGFNSLRWRPVQGDWLPQNVFTRPFECPVIRRPAGTDIEIEISWWASAQHFRNALLQGRGCGGVNPARIGMVENFDHWYTAPEDHGMARTALFRLLGAADGPYTFYIDTYTRAFNPAGDSCQGQVSDWLTSCSYLGAHYGLTVSVIDIVPGT